MSTRDKSNVPASFIFHRREEEKRRMLQAWKAGITGPYLCLPGRKRGSNFSSLILTEELSTLFR